MKKLLFIALFSFGLISMSQAQSTLKYYVENQTSVDWDVALDDSGLSAIVNLSLNPGEIATGQISGFTWDLIISADNNAGCSGSNTESAATASSSITLLCISSYSINYSITQFGSDYSLHLEISG